MKLCYQCKKEPAMSHGMCKGCNSTYQRAYRLKAKLLTAKKHKVSGWRKEFNEYFMEVLGAPWTLNGYEREECNGLGHQRIIRALESASSEAINRHIPKKTIRRFAAEHRLRVKAEEAELAKFGFNPNKIPGGIADRYKKDAKWFNGKAV